MILRLLALAGITLAYGFVAMVVLGALLIGDCFENNPACYAAKDRTLRDGLIVTAVVYVAIIVPAGWAMFRRR